MKLHGGNYTSPAELRQRGVLTNLHKTVCEDLSKITLDDLRLLRDFPEGGSLKIQVKKIEEKTYVFSISLFHFAWGAPFGGNAEGFKRHPSASTGLPVTLGL